MEVSGKANGFCVTDVLAKMYPQENAGAKIQLTTEVDGRYYAATRVIKYDGVMSYAVSQRSRELGLRIALGAGAAELLRLDLSSGLRLTMGGLLLGIGVTLLLTRLVGDLLYQVSPRDPLVFAAAFVVLMLAALSACFVPARRATKVDPMIALKS